MGLQVLPVFNTLLQSSPGEKGSGIKDKTFSCRYLKISASSQALFDVIIFTCRTVCRAGIIPLTKMG